MKVIVNRQLNNSLYTVRFSVKDFTPDELSKMQRFGIPQIRMTRVVGVLRQSIEQPVTQINEQIIASFASEDDALNYQEYVLTQIRQAMAVLREQNDDFTSNQEVDI